MVWGELVSCGIGRAGHDRNLEIGGDAGRGGQTRLGHWMWDPGGYMDERVRCDLQG